MDAAERARFENQVLCEMAALAGTAHAYPDVVHEVLDLVEQVVSSPYLALTVLEGDGIRHYPRVGSDVRAEWGDEADRYVVEMAQRAAHGAPSREVGYHLVAPYAWLASFSAASRSGRSVSLTLGSPRPLTLQEEEERVMVHLTQQCLLVLDHALLMEEIERREVTDGLTGLVNYRRLVEMIEYELQRHRFSGRHLAIVLVDVRRLRAINRTYGQKYGDHVLRRVAAMLQELARPVDLVARAGMDEFAVLLPELDDDGAHQLEDQIHERLPTLGFAGAEVNVSVAAVHAAPDEIITAEGLLRRGEQILFEAKRQERDRHAYLQR